MANNFPKKQFAKIAHYLSSIKQLSQRYITSDNSEVEKTFYTQQIKDIFLQILQPIFHFQQQNFAEPNVNSENKKNILAESEEKFAKQIAKEMFDANFALKIILQESVINHPSDSYKENENLIIGQLEDSIQTIDFVDIDKQQCQLVTIALPILSWSSYGFPKGNISNVQCKKIAKILRETIASKENKAIILTNYLFDKNEVPNSYLSAAQLTNSLLNSYLIMRKNNVEKSKNKTTKTNKNTNKNSTENTIFIAEIYRTETVKIIGENSDNNTISADADDYDYDDYDTVAYVDVDGDECSELNNRDISEVKFLLAAFITPKNNPTFSWMNVNEKTNLLFTQEDIYKKWYKKIMPTMEDIFTGCNFQTLLPETLFKAMQMAIKISRRYGLESLLKYLRSIIGIIPIQLSVLVAGFYSFENIDDKDNKDDNYNNKDNKKTSETKELLKEFRLSFRVRNSSQILCGYTWKLSDSDFNINKNNDISEEENLSEIMEILKENNILDIHFIDNHFEYCLCQNCQQRLYINDDNELIHPKLPDYLVFNKPN